LAAHVPFEITVSATMRALSDFEVSTAVFDPKSSEIRPHRGWMTAFDNSSYRVTQSFGELVSQPVLELVRYHASQYVSQNRE
jgi:hypothetical protein